MHAKTSEELIEVADMALYHAKRSGKNCVVEYDPNGSIIVARG